MALSVNAQRALEQVKMGLFMLYGAEYFTEDEWIKIDGLVHKGRYVFTRGPPNNVLEDQPLMTFEDTNEEPKLNGHLTTTNSLPEHTSSSSSGHAQSILGETPNEASPEASSDEEAYHFISTSLAEPSPMFDFSEHKSPVSSENTSPATSEPTEISKVNHLPPGCTQEQLDEIKAFNATLTKAGQKTRPKYAPVDEYPSSNWTAEPSGEANQENRFPSPAPTEREARISSWASEVDAAEQTTVEIAAPEPLAAQEIFKKIHGRAPKNTNDFWQPNNPNFRGPTGSKRSESRASNKTARTTKSVAKSVAKSVISPPARVHDGPRPHLQVASGTILKAQTEAAAKGIQLQVSPGDQIQVLTHVSGVMHMGVNLRTKKRGQFSEAIFKKAPDEAVVGTSHTGQKAPVERESVVHRSVQNGLDAVEAGNAAEWEEESVFNSKASESQVESDRASEWNTVPIAPRVLLKNPTTLAAKPAGLAASRFSVLADMRSDTKSQSELSAGPLEITPEMRKEVGKIIDNKVEEILRLRGMATPPTSGFRSKQGLKIASKEPLKPVVPKTETCWFWKTGKGCRFTAEECRDAHELLPTPPGGPTNLHYGKPTWGAAVDYAPPTNNSKTKTCYYWANDGKCNYSAADCKYLHEYNGAGVAEKPWKSVPKQWAMQSWVKNAGSVVGSGDGEGEVVLEEGSAWGGSTTAGDDNKYKPPHIKAKEEQARIEAPGW